MASESPANFTGVAPPGLYVKDTTASVGFYRDVWGFSVTSYYGDWTHLLQFERSPTPKTQTCWHRGSSKRRFAVPTM